MDNYGFSVVTVDGRQVNLVVVSGFLLSWQPQDIGDPYSAQGERVLNKQEDAEHAFPGVTSTSYVTTDEDISQIRHVFDSDVELMPLTH